MPRLKYLPPEEKKMYMIVALGVASFGLGLIGNAMPVFGSVAYPLATFCAVAFVFALMGPSEKLFPLRTLPRRTSPALWAWIVYLAKALLFFGGTSAVLYFVFRALRGE